MKSIEWTITKHQAPGGAWMVMRVESHGENWNPDFSASAFTTLSHARRSIVDELRLSKRVRMTKHSDTHYTYHHNA
jgi:hypothetical protein